MRPDLEGKNLHPRVKVPQVIYKQMFKSLKMFLESHQSTYATRNNSLCKSKKSE